jgi:hypothetical protein
MAFAAFSFLKTWIEKRMSPNFPCKDPKPHN